VEAATGEGVRGEALAAARAEGEKVVEVSVEAMEVVVRAVARAEEAPAEAKAEEAGAGTRGVATAAAPTAAQLAARAVGRRRIVHSRHTKSNRTPKPSLGRARSTKCRTGGAGGRAVLAVEARAAYLAVSVVMPAAI
jgi:hypothetical protein